MGAETWAAGEGLAWAEATGPAAVGSIRAVVACVLVEGVVFPAVVIVLVEGVVACPAVAGIVLAAVVA